MDKLAGLYTQIQTLKKRLNSLDLSKEDPGVASALKSDLDALEDRYTKISEAKKKRQQEKLSKDAPVTPEVTKEALPESEVKPESVMDTKCEGCGKPLGPEAFLSKWPVCGACTRKRHKDVTKSAEPEPSIADKLTSPAPAPTAPVVESAEELEAKKKKKNCSHCGFYFPVGGSIVSHPCSHAAPGDTCPAASSSASTGAPAGGDAGAGAAGGGAAAASETPTAILHKFSNDDIVEPTKGTPGSWGSVLRHDGGPEDLVYVKWHGGPLKEMHNGYGGYTASDLKRKAGIESAAKKPKSELDNLVQQAVYGYQVNIMDMSKIHQAGEAAYAKGEDVIAAVHAFLDQLVVAGRAQKVASLAKNAEADCVKCGDKVPYSVSDKQTGGPWCYKCMTETPYKSDAKIEKKEDLEVDAKQNIQVMQDFFHGATAGSTENLKIQKVTLGTALINYKTPIAFHRESDDTYFLNIQKYSVTTSKIQGQIRGFGVNMKEVDENGIYAAMKSEAKPHVPSLQDHTPSMPLGDMPEPSKEEMPLQVASLVPGLTKKAIKVEFAEDTSKPNAPDASLEGLTKFLNKEFQAMDPKSRVDSMESRIEDLCVEWGADHGFVTDINPDGSIKFVPKHLAGPGTLASSDPAEKSGVGYGGDRPGSAVAPARDEDVTLDASLSKIGRVVHQKDGWHVLSEKGKNLGGPYGSKEEAVKRLRQVEYFKHHGSFKLSSRDIKADISNEITQQVEKIRERMTTFQEGLKTQASAGSDEAFKILRLDIEKLRQRYGDYPEAKEALDAIVYEMEQLMKTPGTPEATPVKEGAGTAVPPKPSQDPGLNMMWWFDTATNTWEIKDKTI
jgi:hypothetical protein